MHEKVFIRVIQSIFASAVDRRTKAKPHKMLCTLTAIALFIATIPTHAAEPAPGDPCPTADIIVETAGPETIGVRHILRCNGTIWQQQQTIDAAGNTGIGTATPQAPLHVAGEAIIGRGSLGCTSAQDGALRFTSSTDLWEFCDGSAWVPFETCTPPTSCPAVGDVCGDGSQFAGFMLYNGSTSCEPLFVTGDNQSASSQWKTSTGTNDISTDDQVDGRVNHAGRGGILSAFPALELCESNAYHGKNDWYLPARDELHLLWKNRAAINANAAGAFTTAQYWSSSEYNTFNAWYQTFVDGGVANIAKTNSYDVRCVRRN